MQHPKDAGQQPHPVQFTRIDPATVPGLVNVRKPGVMHWMVGALGAFAVNTVRYGIIGLAGYGLAFATGLLPAGLTIGALSTVLVGAAAATTLFSTALHIYTENHPDSDFAKYARRKNSDEIMQLVHKNIEPAIGHKAAHPTAAADTASPKTATYWQDKLQERDAAQPTINR